MGTALQRRSHVAVRLAVLCLLGSGCATFAGDQLSDISPAPPSSPPVIEQTIGDFTFHLDGGKMVTSNKAGRNINKEILRRWKKAGFIASYTYVEAGKFSGNAAYNLTLQGHQEGESSVGMQILSGLTLFIIPYWVHQDHDLTYVLEHVATGRRFEATASDKYTAVVALLLAPVSPFLLGGAMKTWTRLGNHLYEQLADQGAFDPTSWPAEEVWRSQQEEEVEPVPPPSSPDDGDPAAVRLRRLDELRDEGLISEEEYERKRDEILEGL